MWISPLRAVPYQHSLKLWEPLVPKIFARNWGRHFFSHGWSKQVILSLKEGGPKNKFTVIRINLLIDLVFPDFWIFKWYQKFPDLSQVSRCFQKVFDRLGFIPKKNWWNLALLSPNCSIDFGGFVVFPSMVFVNELHPFPKRISWEDSLEISAFQGHPVVFLV